MALAEFIVTFREFFEIAFLIGILLAYLRKTGNERLNGYAYLGIALAAVASVLTALAFEKLAGGFEANEALFEGVALVLAAAFVTWLIVWMSKQGNVADSVRKGLQTEIEKGKAAGIVLFAFIAVFREGVEVVLFLGGIGISTGTVNLFGAFAGAALAIVLAYAVFRSVVKLDVGLFFKITTILLILLAAGLLSQGVHELQEVGVLPTIMEHVYDINPPVNPDGTYPLLHDKGALGSVAKGVVGYDGSPSLLQIVSYVAYVVLAYLALFHGKNERRPGSKRARTS